MLNMKILQINNVHYRRGGADAVYLNTSELLQQHGNEVVFFNMKKKNNDPCKDEHYWVDGLENCGRNPFALIKHLRNFFYNPEAAKKLEKLIVAEKPDIAHIHLFYGMGISPSICKVLRKHNIPLVHTVHDYRMICPISLLMDKQKHVCEKCQGKHYYKAMLEGCSHNGRIATYIKAAEMYFHDYFFPPLQVIDGFVFVSNFSYQKHCQYMPGLKNAQTTILYNFVDNGVLQSKGSKGNNFDRYFLYYGRLSYEKGISTLLNIFAHHPELKLKVVGTGPLETELRAQYGKSVPAEAIVQQKECYENIQFLGYHSGRTLFELVRNARFVCVPSECYENNPMTIIESYSLGTPVIGANIGGIPEIIEDGKTGFLFEAGDSRGLESVILKTNALQEQEYASLRSNAYHFYEQKFSPEQHYKRLMDFYQNVLGNFNLN